MVGVRSRGRPAAHADAQYSLRHEGDPALGFRSDERGSGSSWWYLASRGGLKRGGVWHMNSTNAVLP
jgi:hypothetical protein